MSYTRVPKRARITGTYRKWERQTHLAPIRAVLNRQTSAARHGLHTPQGPNAANADAAALAVDLEAAGFNVNAASLGSTAQAFNNFRGTRTVEHTVRDPVRIAPLNANGPTGALEKRTARSTDDVGS